MVGSVAVIPAYNEEKHVAEVIRQTAGYVDAIVVIDDGSKDATFEKASLVKKQHVHVLRHLVNLGKGAALKTGTEYALNTLKPKHIIYIDADMQHHPHEIPRMLKALEQADIVFGCRTFNKTMPFIFRFGNMLLTRAIQLLYGVYIPDTQSGYRAFRSQIYEKIVWSSTNYAVESEMIANVGKAKLRYKALSIDTVYNDRYKGTTIFDGIKIFADLILWKLR